MNVSRNRLHNLTAVMTYCLVNLNTERSLAFLDWFTIAWQLHVFKLMTAPPRERMRPGFEASVVIVTGEGTSAARAF
jgi:hypothetical protein